MNVDALITLAQTGLDKRGGVFHLGQTVVEGTHGAGGAGVYPDTESERERRRAAAACNLRELKFFEWIENGR